MGFSLSTPPRLPLVAPSILAADFANLGKDCREVIEMGGDLLHIDVMDGHFVPNLTMGPDLCRSLRRSLPDVFLDVHLMVTDPGKFIEPFAKAGANHVSFHIEAPELGGYSGVRPMVDRIRSFGLEAGLAINPSTVLDEVKPVLSIPDLILVMSVHPGYSGQSFISSSLDKAAAIKPLLRSNQRLQMDGGINPVNAPAVRSAGCDVIVAASALFGRPSSERRLIIEGLRG